MLIFMLLTYVVTVVEYVRFMLCSIYGNVPLLCSLYMFGVFVVDECSYFLLSVTYFVKWVGDVRLVCDA